MLITFSAVKYRIIDYSISHSYNALMNRKLSIALKIAQAISDLSRRSNQVSNETISDIPKIDYTPSQMAIQSHAADKAGNHYDIRFAIGDKAISFATRKGLPTEPGKPIALFRQPDHVINYMSWEGEIPKGEYGAGSVSLADTQPAVIKADENHIRFSISDGPNAGNFVLLKQSPKQWLAIKKQDLNRYWEDRPKYKRLKDLNITEDDYIATEKLDGAHFLATINPNGIAYTSQRKSVDGSLLPREDKIPHLRDLKADKQYQGLTLRGELYHDKGFNYTSAILNSSVPKAIENQNKTGLLKFAPFAIAKGPNDEQNLPYEQQLDLIKALSEKLPDYFSPPRQAEKDFEKFYKQIGDENGEGIVIANKNTGQMATLKHRYDYDLEISDIIPGQGKYENAAGAVIVKDKTGREVGKVGTGFTDVMRKDMLNNPEKYKGMLIKIMSQKPLTNRFDINNLRGPSFIGITTDKNEPDEV